MFTDVKRALVLQPADKKCRRRVNSSPLASQTSHEGERAARCFTEALPAPRLLPQSSKAALAVAIGGWQMAPL